MTLAPLRWTCCVLTVALAWPFPSSAFDTPLSDTAVREAYFLGQRRDASLGKLLDKYVLHLQPPKTGPYIESVSFFTPYILTALNSSSRSASTARSKPNSTISRILKWSKSLFRFF